MVYAVRLSFFFADRDVGCRLNVSV